MNTSSVSLQSFRDVMKEYGANPDRWPDSFKLQAKEFLEQSPDPRDLVMELILDQSPENGDQIKAPDGLVDKIMTAALKEDSRSNGVQKPGRSGQSGSGS